MQRKLPWDHEVVRAKPEKITSGMGVSVDFERMAHGARRIVSVIDIPLWDKAHWRGAVFGGSDDLRQPPALGLGFEDEKGGSKSSRAGAPGRRKLAKPISCASPS
jgi:hypothetical protein